MKLDILTISKLAHHRSIETTRKHYDFFDTTKVLGQMDVALEGGNIPMGPQTNGKITALSLHSEPFPDEQPTNK